MEAVADAAAQVGRRIAAEARAASGDAPSASAAVVDVLAWYGYEPRAGGDRMILVNCPFDALAVEHRELVCGINLEMIRGLTEAIGLTDTDVQLNPAPGRCCVTLGP
jgi:predicted ArsR family transcriptional regulator